VLAIDDGGLVLMNTALMLEDLGHNVIEAQSGEEALLLLNEGAKPDLIITDQAMPHMTGVELAAIISARHPGIPIILATGYAELPHGVATDLDRLAKPFLQAQLNEALVKAAGNG
jgi:CheY-like chemotaxis protein